MKSARAIRSSHGFLFILLFLLTSCASGNKYRAGEPWVQQGLASWYGKAEHGNPTASGEIFNMYAFTAAHRTLPFGTYVHVTNLRNNREVVVKINDRGPFIRGRVIDLSYAAAKRIDLLATGVEQVRIEVVEANEPLASSASNSLPSSHQPTGAYAVQIGAFRDKTNAYNLKKVLDRRYDTVVVVEGGSFWRPLYRVHIGPFREHAVALQISKQLTHEGYRPFITIVED